MQHILFYCEKNIFEIENNNIPFIFYLHKEKKPKD
jgi:hypothetical protein